MRSSSTIVEFSLTWLQDLRGDVNNVHTYLILFEIQPDVLEGYLDLGCLLVWPMKCLWKRLY